MAGRTIGTLGLSITSIAIGLAASANAAPLLVAGSPTYDRATGNGLRDGYVAVAPGSGVNNSGTAVGSAEKFISDDYTGDIGERAVRWDASGSAATELCNLEADGNGYANKNGAGAFAINDAGTAVGYSRKDVGTAILGKHAVRWDALGAVTELGNLETHGIAYTTDACAYAVNDMGTAVGYSLKYVNMNDVGTRAVRWDASGTVATELGNLGTDDWGITAAQAYAINNAGTAVGYSEKYVGGIRVATRAVRWDASGTAATELGRLASDDGYGDLSSACAYAINNAGTAVGYSNRYINGTRLGTRAVRWDASGTAVTELSGLGTDSYHYTRGACAYAINDAGTAVGYSYKYVNVILNPNDIGTRAVRWDASGTAATELGVLGTNTRGYTDARAYAVNNAGTAVGYSSKYVNGSNLGNRAVLWLPDTRAVDLNDLGILPVPGGGTWTLTSANAISADGYVAGEGNYDADGTGPLASYKRLWVTQVGLGGSWTKPAGGTWGRGPNWSTGTPAMQVGDATFDLNSAYTVSLDRDELTKTITLSKGTVTLDFAGHKLSTESGLSIAAGAKFKGAGRIESSVQNAGTIALGDSPAALDVDGDLVSTGKLEFEIASLLDHDHIDVSGNFSAGGLMVLKLMGGYAPSAGDTFDLINFGSFSNNAYTFDFSQAALPTDLWWDTSGFGSTGRISVIIPEPGTLTLLIAGLASLAVSFVKKRS